MRAVIHMGIVHVLMQVKLVRMIRMVLSEFAVADIEL